MENQEEIVSIPVLWILMGEIVWWITPQHWNYPWNIIGNNKVRDIFIQIIDQDGRPIKFERETIKYLPVF